MTVGYHLIMCFDNSMTGSPSTERHNVTELGDYNEIALGCNLLCDLTTAWPSPDSCDHSVTELGNNCSLALATM